jgi:hypothetical protein
MIISCLTLLRIGNVSDKFVGKIKAHTLCSVTSSRNFTVYETMWKTNGTAIKAINVCVIWRRKGA